MQDWFGSRFGRVDTGCYNLVIVLRLLFEVFANRIVVGLIFSAVLPEIALAKELSIGLVALLGLAYSAWGSLSAALRTNVLQMVVFLLLFTISLMAMPLCLMRSRLAEWPRCSSHLF